MGKETFIPDILRLLDNLYTNAVSANFSFDNSPSAYLSLPITVENLKNGYGRSRIEDGGLVQATGPVKSTDIYRGILMKWVWLCVIRNLANLLGLVLMTSPLFLPGQVAAPADTLVNSNLNLVQRALLWPIQGWQHITYANPGHNCQFEPSCSHFTALAIAEKGALPGLIVGTDRILRCNPSARLNHLETVAPLIIPDGRLYEPLDFAGPPRTSRSPRLAMTLSIVPGLGRVYAGHVTDGIISSVLIAALGSSAYLNGQRGNSGRAVFQGSLTMLFWITDFYGAWNSARLTTPD